MVELFPNCGLIYPVLKRVVALFADRYLPVGMLSGVDIPVSFTDGAVVNLSLH